MIPLVWLVLACLSAGFGCYWAFHRYRRPALPEPELPDLRVRASLPEELRVIAERARGVRVAISTSESVVVPDTGWRMALDPLWRSRVWFWSGGTEDGHEAEEAAASAEADARQMWWKWRAEVLRVQPPTWAQLGSDAPTQAEIASLKPATCSLADADGLLARFEIAASSST